MNSDTLQTSNLVELSIPTPSASAADRANQLVEKAAALTVRNADEYTYAAADLKEIKSRWAAIEAERKALKRPIDEAAARVQAFFARPLKALERAEAIIKQKLVAYSDEQDRLRREEQRRANEIAEKQRKRLEEAAQRNRAKGNEAAAEDFAERASMIVAPIAQQRAPEVSGIAIPLVWVGEIVDATKLPREFLMPDLVRINKQVAATKGDTQIPGVMVKQIRRIAAGRA